MPVIFITITPIIIKLKMSTTPTTLEAYYCEDCSYVEITTEPIDLAPGVDVNCPHCEDGSLVLLDKEQYKVNFNPDLFPYPQNLLLKTFFENVDDRVQLFTLFAKEQPLLACSEQIQDLTIVLSFKFVLYPDLIAICSVTDSEEIKQVSTSSISPLIDIFETS